MPRIQQRGKIDMGLKQQQQQQPRACDVSLSNGNRQFQLPELPLASFSVPFAAMGQQGLPERVAERVARWATDLFAPERPPQVTSSPPTGSPSSRLRAALRSYNALSPDWKAAVLGVVLSGGGLLGGVGNLMSPTGPGGCDHNMFERCANCATSVPYVLVGVHAMKHRKTSAGKAWGASMCAVGMASTTFHASSGRFRTIGRRMDYWSIALASNLLTRSVYPDIPASVTAAGMLLTPFRPFLVSFLNSTAMELRFLQRARARPELRYAQRLHATTCLAGLGAFALEEFFPRLPLVHAAWHCLSATAVATVNHLLEDVEEQHLAASVAKLAYQPEPLMLTATCTPLN